MRGGRAYGHCQFPRHPQSLVSATGSEQTKRLSAGASVAAEGEVVPPLVLGLHFEGGRVQGASFAVTPQPVPGVPGQPRTSDRRRWPLFQFPLGTPGSA